MKKKIDDERNRAQSADRRPAHLAHRDPRADTMTDTVTVSQNPGRRVSRTRWRRAVKRVRELSARVHRLRQENADLRRLAYRDPLTGLLNRRGFEEHLDRAVLQASERGIEVAVLFFDVDELKRINDTRGHAAGDAALRSVAVSLRRSVRAGDQVGRLAGDEFAVLLPRTGRDQARRIAERVRTVLQQEGAAIGIAVTVSAGVGVLEPDEVAPASAELLLGRADRALYAAKRAGRDRVDDAVRCASGE